MYDVARPPRPCRKDEGALATTGFATAAIHLTMITQDGIVRNPNSWDVQFVITLDDLFW